MPREQPQNTARNLVMEAAYEQRLRDAELYIAEDRGRRVGVEDRLTKLEKSSEATRTTLWKLILIAAGGGLGSAAVLRAFTH